MDLRTSFLPTLPAKEYKGFVCRERAEKQQYVAVAVEGSSGAEGGEGKSCVWRTMCLLIIHIFPVFFSTNELSPIHCPVPSSVTI